MVAILSKARVYQYTAEVRKLLDFFLIMQIGYSTNAFERLFLLLELKSFGICFWYCKNVWIHEYSKTEADDVEPAYDPELEIKNFFNDRNEIANYRFSVRIRLISSSGMIRDEPSSIKYIVQLFRCSIRFFENSNF